MKTIKNLIAACTLMILGSCTEKEHETTKPGITYQFTEVKGREKTFPTYRISVSDQPTDNDFQRESLAAAALDNLAPIPLARNAKLNQIECTAAINAYKSFLVKYKGDSVLIRHFRDRYASRLLDKQGSLDQLAPEQLRFLAEELIRAKTGRLETIIQVLGKLKSTTDPEVFSQLVSATQQQVKVSLELHQAAQQRLTAMLKKLKKGELEPSGTLKKEFTVALIEKDDFQQDIRLLEGYQQRLVNL